MIPKLFQISFFILAFQVGLFSQNLLPNPSFEDVNVCHKYEEECSPKAWRNTLLKNFAYREYIGETSNRYKIGVKQHIIVPPDGSRYVAVRVFNKIGKDDRTFIQAPLLCELVAGQTYEISFQYYVTTYVVEELEIALVDTLQVFKKNTKVFEIEPQIHFNFDKKVKPKKWHRLTTTFVATGIEQGLIIGNFNTDENTVLTPIIRRKEKNLPKRAHYILDDFSLMAVDSFHKSDCDLDKNRKFIYADSIRHIIYEKIKTIADIEVPIIPVEVVEEIELEAPEIEEEKTSLIIGQQEVSIKEDFVFSNITFENNKAILKSVAFRPLEDIAQFLMMHREYQLQITGHTDEIGSTAFNQRLSNQRAQAVANFLIQKGIAHNRLIVIGKGELAPLATNETKAGRELNRRVTFKILQK